MKLDEISAIEKCVVGCSCKGRRLIAGQDEYFFRYSKLDIVDLMEFD